jgi:hypothetical protein
VTVLSFAALKLTKVGDHRPPLQFQIQAPFFDTPA